MVELIRVLKVVLQGIDRLYPLELEIEKAQQSCAFFIAAYKTYLKFRLEFGSNRREKLLKSLTLIIIMLKQCYI